ncbi:MAG: hypothetical protein ACYDBJ_21255 [Aggregatilineales bacterium]
MPKTDSSRPDQPLREIEQAAYHAFREWPILLVLREKELAALQTPAAATEKTEDSRS